MGTREYHKWLTGPLINRPYDNAHFYPNAAISGVNRQNADLVMVVCASDYNP